MELYRDILNEKYAKKLAAVLMCGLDKRDELMDKAYEESISDPSLTDSKKKTFLCRTDQIDEVLYKGYQDDKGQILLAKLNNYQKVDNQNNKVADIVHKEDDYRQKDGLKTAGTIVRLKDNPVLNMIAGYYPKGKKAIKDYFGVVYPFGYRKEKYNSGFDESDIEEVIFNGYQDKAALSFLVDLPEYMQMATDVFIEATQHIKNTNDENTINNEQNVSINLQME